MSRSPKPPVFFHRATYRQRRLRDAARLVPVLGLLLWAIPLTWRADETGTVGAAGLVYVFGVWLFLIVLTAVLASGMRDTKSVTDESETEA